MPDEKASSAASPPGLAAKSDKPADQPTAAPQANGAAGAVGQAVAAAEGEKNAAPPTGDLATSKPPTVEERLSAVESELDDLKTAVASLGAPQVTQSKHDGLKGFLDWFEQRFEL